MGCLKDLFNKLNDQIYCRYSTEDKYPTIIDGKIAFLKPKELLEVGRVDPREHVMIAYFGNEPTRIAYFGEDAQIMKKTIKNLKIPRYSENLGEELFSRFLDSLDEIKGKLPIWLELTFKQGKEHKLELILKKLIRIYGGGEIDSEFYQNLKKNHDSNSTFFGSILN